MDRSSPTPHHRHRSSLEGVIFFSSEPLLDANVRAHAKRKFYHIVHHFETTRTNSGDRTSQYNRPLLLRLTYEHARSDESRDIFLRAFFRSMMLPIDSADDIDLSTRAVEEELGLATSQFADYLFDNFFLPLGASSKKTPQPSPVYHSAVQQAQGGGIQDFVGTPGRVSELRGDCLVRDHHRCVISRQFDADEAANRFDRDGNDAKDDDGNLLLHGTACSSLEVAHILPHALTKTEPDSELDASKKAALDILNMFDTGVVHMIEGDNIDRPRNAITLTHTLHRHFGSFRVFFRPVADAEPHTYRIDSFHPYPIVPDVPVTRTLLLSPNRTIDPPSQRLLELHCAIAHILHMSAAGKYIDRILDDRDKKAIRADGSTNVGRLVALGLGGWLGDRVCV